MGCASSFYEVGSGAQSGMSDKNIIVEKSKYIHEVALVRVDQELAEHLRNIEVLPQIFLACLLPRAHSLHADRMRR